MSHISGSWGLGRARGASRFAIRGWKKLKSKEVPTFKVYGGRVGLKIFFLLGGRGGGKLKQLVDSFELSKMAKFSLDP